MYYSLTQHFFFDFLPCKICKYEIPELPEKMECCKYWLQDDLNKETLYPECQEPF